MSTEKPIYRTEPPSELFIEIFDDGGQLQKECLCGRQHIATWDLEEPEELSEEAQKDPERNELGSWRKWIEKTKQEGIEHEYSSLHWIEVGGRTWVVHCPCNYARMWEDLFWRERFPIAQYLEARAKEEKKAKDGQAAALIGLEQKLK